MTRSVTVVGGGAIGLAAAWRTAQRGARTVVVDPEPGRGATDVAAGMLAPVTEVHYGEVPLLALNLESARRWPSFVTELEAAAGIPVGYRQEGTLVVAVRDDDLRALDALVQFQRQLGLPVERLRSTDCRDLEPALTPRIRGGALVAGDHQVDPRTLALALLRAGASAGVELVRRRAIALAPGPRVELDNGDELASDVVVVAAGCRSAELVDVPVRPVKGQILRLRGDVAALLTRTIRGLAESISVYLVPRTGGELVVGATVEERGFDTTVTAGAVHELLDAACRLLPVVTELELVEARAGLRPGTPDNAPIIGAAPGLDDVFVASGHYRNGILLTPVTADAVADLTVGVDRAPVTVPFTADRFR